MANRYLHNKQSINRGVVQLSGRFRILGNTTPANGTFTKVYGDGIASFARSGAGEYTITLSDKWSSLLGAKLQVLAATAIDLVPQLKSETVASTKLVVFNMLAGATPTDTANGVTQDVFVTLELKNTSVAR
jgi:hypothetical protein